MTLTLILLIAAFIGIILVKHFFFWTPLDVSHFYADGPLKIGHRGSPKEAPENTLPSYRKAVEAGLKIIEIDVTETRDGRIVCSHNQDLERETDGNGYIFEKTYSEIENVDAGVKFPEFSPCKMPLLEEVIDELPDDIIIDIEIKANRIFDYTAADRVVEIIKRRNLYYRVFVSSFHPFIIGRVKWLDKRIVTGYIWDIENVPKLLRKPRFINLVHPDLFHPAIYLVNEDTLRFSRRKGLRINVWTVNNRPAMEWLLKLGVDGIFSDFPKLMHEALEKYKCEHILS